MSVVPRRRRRMGRVPRRILHMLVTLWVASLLVWSLLALAPGDPARRVLNGRGVVDPTDAQLAAERLALGLDRPAWERYLDWLGGAVRGDFGQSWRTGRPISDELAVYLPATINLTLAALLIALAVALPLGLLGAATAGRWPDAVIRVVTLVMVSTPAFVIGVVLLYVVVLRWGAGNVVADGTWSNAWLPAITLAAWPAASWARILRAGLLESMSATYLHVSEARGAGRLRLLVTHALPNASVPFLAVFGVSVGWLLAGAPVVETVFTWPGIGRYTVESIIARDVPVVQAFTMLAVLLFVLSSLAVDLLSTAIDPRLRERGRPAGSMAGEAAR